MTGCLKTYRVLQIAASLLVIFNLMTVPRAYAAPQLTCDTIEHATKLHHNVSGAADCCDEVHCCPMLPDVAQPLTPAVANFCPVLFLHIAQPLLLIYVVDPPPRALA